MIDKKAAFLFLLEQAFIVRVAIKPKVAGVSLPSLPESVAVVLEFGLNLPKPVDLSVSDVGIEATLSFNNTPQRVTLPWNSVFSMGVHDQVEFFWAADSPRDGQAVPPTQNPSKKPERGGLRSV